MNTPAKAAYLTALIAESQQREQSHQATLAGCTTCYDRAASTARLSAEQARQQELRTDLAAL